MLPASAYDNEMFDDTIAVAKRLKGDGFLPVPHFAARGIPDSAFLDDKLARLAGETPARFRASHSG